MFACCVLENSCTISEKKCGTTPTIIFLKDNTDIQTRQVIEKKRKKTVPFSGSHYVAAL